MADSLPTPQGWRVLVKRKKPKDKTDGGLLLPDQAIEAESYMNICAQVIKVGPLCWHDRETGQPWKGPVWAKPGDWVIIPKFVQFKMEIDGEIYHFVNDDEIIATVSDPSKIKVYT